MKPLFKQNQPYGCGMYAVANTCNLQTYVTDQRLEESKGSNNIGQLSKWMQEDGLELFVDPLYINYQGSKLPNDLMELKADDKTKQLPLLLHIQESEQSLSHMIGLRLDEEGLVYLIDSRKDEIVITNMYDLNDRYWKIYGIYVFALLDGSSSVSILI